MIGDNKINKNERKMGFVFSTVSYYARAIARMSLPYLHGVHGDER